MSLGSLHIGRASDSDLKDTPDAVATIFVYGSKGGRSRTELIGEEDARHAVRDLLRFAGVPRPEIDLSDMTEVTTELRRLVTALNELRPNGFMNNESFASINTGLMRFEYIAGKQKAAEAV